MADLFDDRRYPASPRLKRQARREGRSPHSRDLASALVMLAALITITVVVPVESVGCKDDNDGNVGEFVIRYRAPSSYGYRDRLKLVQSVDAFVAENQEKWGIRTWSSRMRGTSPRGRTFVYLDQDRGEDAMSREEVIADARKNLPESPGVRMGIGWGGGGGPPDAAEGGAGGPAAAIIQQRGAALHSLPAACIMAACRRPGPSLACP